MAIIHAVVKAPGQTLAAVADWNANHTIDPNTITAAQTQFADQNLKIASSPTFSALTITNNIIVGGNVDGVDVSAFKTAYDAHAADSTDPHGVTLTQTNITSSGEITGGDTLTIVTGDHGAAATDEVVNVSYGTGAPPDPATMTEGALFVKYTA